MAESLAAESGAMVYYLATMPRLAGDREQDARIERHRKRRPSSWSTVECPYNLAEAIEGLPASGGTCLVDCLSLFISNLLLNETCEANPSSGTGASTIKDPYEAEHAILQGANEVLEAIGVRRDYNFVVVTNEAGWGVVPESSLGRAFRDFLGLVNQRFARRSSAVWLTCAGLPLQLKPAKP